MANYNRIIMGGYITRDPELKQLQTGQAVCRLNLASNRQFKNKTGTLVQEVCFIDIDAWGPLAETCNQHLRKGRAVLVEGRLKQDTWKEADGQPRSKYSIVAERIVFLGSSATTESSLEATSSPEETTDVSSIASRRAPSARLDTSMSSTNQSKSESSSFKDVPPFEDELPF